MGNSAGLGPCITAEECIVRLGRPARGALGVFEDDVDGAPSRGRMALLSCTHHDGESYDNLTGKLAGQGSHWLRTPSNFFKAIAPNEYATS